MIQNNLILEKDFSKKVLEINSFDVLKESLTNEHLNWILYIKWNNTRNFIDIFEDTFSKYHEIKIFDNTYEINYQDLIENNELDFDWYNENEIKEIEKEIEHFSIIEINAIWYSQRDYQDYSIIFDNRITNEKEVREYYKWIKFLFTVSELYLNFYNEYTCILKDENQNIIKTYIESEKIENACIIINWNESNQEIIKQVQESLNIESFDWIELKGNFNLI